MARGTTAEKPSTNGKGGHDIIMPTKKIIQARDEKIHIAKFRVVSRKGSPLLVKRLSDEVADAIERKQMGLPPPEGKKFLDPEYEWKMAPYVDSDGDECLPASAFKSALVESFVKGKTETPKTVLKKAIIMSQDLVKLEYNKKDRHQVRHLVRQDNGGVALSYRIQYDEWACEFYIEYIPAYISLDNLNEQVSEAGKIVGVGCWRPENGGNRGRFQVAAAN